MLAENTKIKAINLEPREVCKGIDSVQHQNGLLYVFVPIKILLISTHHYDPLAGQFAIEKMRKLIA